MTRKGGATMVLVPGGPLGDFWMDATPVTAEQFREFCEVTGQSMPAPPPWGWLDRHPMVNVTWHQATAYAAWAGGRLPTHAEWEFTARDGGKEILYPWGDAFDASNVWCSLIREGDAGGTVSVRRADRLYTNALGLSDLGGNVWQWSSDGPDRETRYPCGGSWYGCRVDSFLCTSRGRLLPSDSSQDGGFRFVA